jgi:hypothetical protein
MSLVRQNDLKNSERGEELNRNGRKLTCPKEMQNVSKSDTSESQRLLLQQSRAPKTTVFKRHIRNQSLPLSVTQERMYQVERV